MISSWRCPQTASVEHCIFFSRARTALQPFISDFSMAFSSSSKTALLRSSVQLCKETPQNRFAQNCCYLFLVGLFFSDQSSSAMVHSACQMFLYPAIKTLTASHIDHLVGVRAFTASKPRASKFFRIAHRLWMCTGTSIFSTLILLVGSFDL